MTLPGQERQSIEINPECPSCEGRRRLWVAFGEVIGTDILLNAFNQVIKGEDYGVSFESWGDNLRDGWNFDDNTFGTNQYAHPYNGNIYFNAARSNGYGYWSSIPFTAVGSFVWEYFGEIHRPALNDFISTTVGGVALGELTFQLSTLLIDQQATGKARTNQELTAFLVNPVRGLNRLIFGDWGRVAPNPPTRTPELLRGSVEVGLRLVGDDSGFDNARLQPNAIFTFHHGDPLTRRFRHPFDWFSIRIEVNAAEKQILSRLSAAGRLYGTPLAGGDAPRHAFFISQNYDYYNTTAFELGGQSVTGAVTSRFPLGDVWSLQTLIGPRVVILGAVNSEFVDGPNRDYDFGPGAGFDFGLDVYLGGHRLVRTRYGLQWIHNINGLAGDHLLREGTVEVDVPVSLTLGVGGSFFLYNRKSTYRAEPNVTEKTPEFRAYLRWRIK